MPQYVYECVNCERRWSELRHTNERDDAATCERCEAPGHRQVTAIGGYSGNTGGGSTKPRKAGAMGNYENIPFKKDEQ